MTVAELVIANNDWQVNEQITLQDNRNFTLTVSLLDLATKFPGLNVLYFNKNTIVTTDPLKSR